jgi:Domain of unknown function (DUF1707)/Cell wall-active antibiotics response 4TMS YvqF
MLADALGDGRLTADEHSERMSVALSARTLGELVPLTADLAPATEQPLRLEGGRVITGLFGTELRTGRWVAPPVLTCSAVCGEVIVDFREAILQDRHVVVYAHAFGGRIRLIVPSGVEVLMNGTVLFGRKRGATVLALPQARDVPVIEVRALVIGGEVVVRTPPRPRRWLPRWRRSALE